MALARKGLPLFALLQDLDDLPAPGRLIWEGPHEHAKAARDSHYRIAQGRIILTLWRRKLHCIIYQTPLPRRSASLKRNAELFEHYGDGKKWKEILDNGFGKSYWRSDGKRFALWSYAMDFATFGTKEFHALEWGTT